MMHITLDDFKVRGFSSRNLRRIEALMRRADFLRARVATDTRELSFDRAEMSALEWAIMEIYRNSTPTDLPGRSDSAG